MLIRAHDNYGVTLYYKSATKIECQLYIFIYFSFGGHNLSYIKGVNCNSSVNMFLDMSLSYIYMFIWSTLILDINHKIYVLKLYT